MLHIHDHDLLFALRFSLSKAFSELQLRFEIVKFQIFFK